MDGASRSATDQLGDPLLPKINYDHDKTRHIGVARILSGDALFLKIVMTTFYSHRLQKTVPKTTN